MGFWEGGRNVNSPACLPRESPEAVSHRHVGESLRHLREGEFQGAMEKALKSPLTMGWEWEIRDACCEVQGRRNRINELGASYFIVKT